MEIARRYIHFVDGLNRIIGKIAMYEILVIMAILL
ncbi:hypothetical protein SAMN04488026_101427 [Aliiruegeria lutimaris]|uniref:Uncharacterized protein n=1 Tax=Aliiruegeria lutimaris TaxID=571298 RepID=A0A1G8S1S7_9RHOB|nr:hypothetical protein SAMN04488026_101427 [Aliiruegeria lutimaris]